MWAQNVCKRLPCRLALDLIYSHSAAYTTGRRYASSTGTTDAQTKFPYPKHRNPTPHQIFHLPRNATENDIKERYFDLVRIYHPDKALGSASADEAHARFQAITAAYDILRGKTPLPDSSSSTGLSAQDRSYQMHAAFRAAQRRRQELYTSGAVDDGWKDKIILAGVIVTVLVVMVQTLNARRHALAAVYSRPPTRHTKDTYNASQREEDAKLALLDSNDIDSQSKE